MCKSEWFQLLNKCTKKHISLLVYQICIHDEFSISQILNKNLFYLKYVGEDKESYGLLVVWNVSLYIH